MRTLIQALSDHELTVLQVMGEWWELDLSNAGKNECIQQLLTKLESLDMAEELTFLPEEEVQAVRDLAQAGGRIPVAVFTRKHGEVRQMGPAALEREEPWFDPISPAESLWYRGFLYRAFDESVDGFGEFYYLPKSLLPAISPATPPIAKANHPPSKLPHIPPQTNYREAPTDAVDDLTTLLAIAQNRPLPPEIGTTITPYLLDDNPIRADLLATLAKEMGLLREDGKPSRDAIIWLKLGREAQLRELVEAWSGCQWNALHHTPQLQMEGSGWHNDPILPRVTLLENLPQSIGWHEIKDVVTLIKEKEPDFQRPDGNYETWYIRDSVSGEFLRGFEYWNQVEGRVLTFLLQGPLHWLGMVDISAEGHYRITERMVNWLTEAPLPAIGPQVPPTLRTNGILLVPHNTNRFHRFQLGRVANLQPIDRQEQKIQPFIYHLTPDSLQRAQKQGINPDRVNDFLAQVTTRPVPAGIKRALERWGTHGIEGKLEDVIILRVKNPDILSKLRANAKTSPYLGETLSDLAIVVRDQQKLQQAAIQLGLLLDG